MRRVVLAAAFVGVCFHVAPARAFMEEGNNWTTGTSAFTKCAVPGDLSAAQSTGCNPWADTDANYSYLNVGDQKKSSMHFNMTMALALGAGYTRCAAYIIALTDEATDVASATEQMFWAPFPKGVSKTACGTLFNSMGIVVANGLDSTGKRTVPGATLAPAFTYRSTPANSVDAELTRESDTFHWNPTYNSLTSPYSVQCSPSGNPYPTPPSKDMLTLSDLYSWASTTADPLNKCTGYGTASSGAYGPITRYYPSTTYLKPNTLAAFGIFLHAFQDSISHSDITAQGLYGHTTNAGATTEPAGFVSAHYAGEFGVMPATGLPGFGTLSVSTPASTTPWTVTAHSQDTVDAINETFSELQLWLKSHKTYQQLGAPICSAATINSFATAFTSIPNKVPATGEKSGARKRSDMADSFFYNGNCTW